MINHWILGLFSDKPTSEQGSFSSALHSSLFSSPRRFFRFTNRTAAERKNACCGLGGRGTSWTFTGYGHYGRGCYGYGWKSSDPGEQQSWDVWTFTPPNKLRYTAINTFCSVPNWPETTDLGLVVIYLTVFVPTWTTNQGFSSFQNVSPLWGEGDYRLETSKRDGWWDFPRCFVVWKKTETYWFNRIYPTKMLI